jgi:citrate synthase
MRKNMPATYQTMGSAERDAVHVRGRNLCTDLIGTAGFTDMVYLEILGTPPSAPQRAVLDAVLVALTEHGLTPTAVAARLTDLGAPGAIQGAVAAGLLGAGDHFLGAVDGTARLLQEWADGDDDAYAAELVACFRRDRRRIPGLGHPTHTEGDPRTVALYQVADKAGIALQPRARLDLVRGHAEAASGRALPVNVDGASGALLTGIGLPWQACRGIAIVARAAGLVGHIWDEYRHPAAAAMWAAAERAVPYLPDGNDATPGTSGGDR